MGGRAKTMMVKSQMLLEQQETWHKRQTSNTSLEEETDNSLATETATSTCCHCNPMLHKMSTGIKTHLAGGQFPFLEEDGSIATKAYQKKCILTMLNIFAVFVKLIPLK